MAELVNKAEHAFLIAERPVNMQHLNSAEVKGWQNI